MPANPMGRGLPMASMVLPEEQAPEVSAEAGAAFLAVLETTQGKPMPVAAVAPAAGPLATGSAIAPAIAPPGGDNLSDAAGEQVEAPATPAIGPRVALTGGDNLSDAAGEQIAAPLAPAPPAIGPRVALTGGDNLSAPTGTQLAPAATGTQLAPPAEALQVPAPAARPVRPRERTLRPSPASSQAPQIAAAPVAVDAAPLAPTPSEPPPAQAPDVAAHVARATEAADASSASSVRAFGLRHVRLAVPSEDGAIRARMTVDRATETVDVTIRGTDDVGLTAARRVSELREGLAQHGLKLGSFDAGAVTTDVARPSAEASLDLFQQAFGGSDQPADPGSERSPQGSPTDERTQTASSDEPPHHSEAPARRTPNRWDDDAPVGQLLDLRI